MKFELIKNTNGWNVRFIEVYCDNFSIEVTKCPQNKITVGGVIQQQEFWDREASIQDLEALNQGSKLALRIANNFEKYWKTISDENQH
jgi:hypothetical protein